MESTSHLWHLSDMFLEGQISVKRSQIDEFHCLPYQQKTKKDIFNELLCIISLKIFIVSNQIKIISSNLFFENFIILWQKNHFTELLKVLN